MKTKKVVCSLMLMASAFFAYSTFNIVKAETSGTQINMSANNEVAPFSNATSLPLGQQNEIYLEDIQPATIKEEKKEVKQEVKKVQDTPAVVQEQATEAPVVDVLEEIKSEVKEEPKAEPVLEDTPVVKEVKKTIETPSEEATEPVVEEEKTIIEVKELYVEEEKVSEEEQKEETTTEAITEEVKIQEVEELENVKKVKEIKEAPKELPNLEDIQLPELQPVATDADTVEIEVSSQRIPVGTVIPVKLESPINSITSAMGDQFNVALN